MKKYKLHQWLHLVLAGAIFMSCNKKNYPVNASETGDKFGNPKAVQAYSPLQVIAINDNEAMINKEGEMYYDDNYGYRYWRSQDGKYYLDIKYVNGASPDKRAAKKKAKKHGKKDSDSDYVNY